MPVFINPHTYVGLSKLVYQQVKGKKGRRERGRKKEGKEETYFDSKGGE